MAKLGEQFNMYDDPTPPRADKPGNGQGGEEKPAETPAQATKPKRSTKPAPARVEAEAPAEIDPATRNLWRTLLQNSARKLARDREQAAKSEQAWPSTVAQARAMGIPEHVILEAAAGANVEVPE